MLSKGQRYIVRIHSQLTGKGFAMNKNAIIINDIITNEVSLSHYPVAILKYTPKLIQSHVTLPYECLQRFFYITLCQNKGDSSTTRAGMFTFKASLIHKMGGLSLLVFYSSQLGFHYYFNIPLSPFKKTLTCLIPFV